MNKPNITITDTEWTPQQSLDDKLARLSWSNRTLILDFDETLWLHNSTEEFLAAVRPSILASLVLQLLGFLKPWSLLSRANPARYRDSIRVAAVLLVVPWSLLLWRRKAKHLGPRHLNEELVRLVDALKPERVIVASYGFEMIVRPLLTAIGRDWELAVAATLRNTELRRIGKGEALKRALGADTLRRGVVITDSFLDRDIGRLSDHIFYTEWDDARFEQAGQYPMLPFGYLSKIKRPNERYILNGVIGYDFIILWLAFVMGSAHLVGYTVAIGLYLVAFFAVYEIGYHENDVLGLKHEAAPVVSEAFHKHGANFSSAWAWSFGLILALVGAAVHAAALLDWNLKSGEGAFVVATLRNWGGALALLIVTRLTFFWFNRTAPRRRIIPMFMLQLQRTLGYLFMLPIGAIGALLCVSHAVGRWVPYVVYRYGGSRKNFPAHVCTLMIFIAFLPIIILLRDDISRTELVSFGVITLYLVLRAFKDLGRFREHQPLTSAVIGARTSDDIRST